MVSSFCATCAVWDRFPSVQIIMIDCTQSQLGASFVTAISTLSSSKPFNSSGSSSVLTDQGLHGHRVSKTTGSLSNSFPAGKLNCSKAMRTTSPWQGGNRESRRSGGQTRPEMLSARLVRRQGHCHCIATPQTTQTPILLLQLSHEQAYVCLAGLPVLLTRAYWHT